MSIPKKGDIFWIGPAFFLLAAAPGFWMPVLTNVLDAQGWGKHAASAFMILPLASIISPLFLAARADQVIAAEKLLSILVFGGTILLWSAFATLEKGNSPVLFLVFLGLNALVTAPAWALLTTVTLTHLKDPERDFGKYRVWGTFGWMAAGWTVSLLAMDVSPSVGKLSIAARLLGACCCFMLPHTPPLGGPAKNLKEALGLGALKILKHRDMAVFFLTAFSFAIPLAAFYLHTPRQLRSMEWGNVAASMTIGQLTEAVAMLLMGWFLKSWRIKWLLALAMICGTLRYSLYALGAMIDSPITILIGVAFHGICWCYFFEAGKVFLEKRVDRDIRAQSQALLSLLTSGIGTLTGTLTVGWLYKKFVNSDTGEGWDTYWWILAGMCGFSLLIFLIFYVGDTNKKEPDLT